MADNFPKIRLALTLGLTIVIGVLSSIFATEIMPNGKLDWALTLKASSFYFLAPASLVLIALQVWFYRGDEKISRFGDDLYCIAHIRSSKMQAMAADLKAHPEKATLIKVDDMLRDMGIKLEDMGIKQ